VTDNILQRWQISADELTEIIDENPSLRGFLAGYVAEYKVRRVWFSPPKVEESQKPDDHDRGEKCDLIVSYRGHRFRIEVKSLQTNSIRDAGEGKYGRFQCDASDKREVVLPNGKKVSTTCLKVDEFDVVAVNLYAFNGRWEYAFARNRDLPRTSHRAYTKYQRQHLLASLVPVTWPLEPPFRPEPYSLLDEIIQEREQAG